MLEIQHYELDWQECACSMSGLALAKPKTNEPAILTFLFNNLLLIIILTLDPSASRLAAAMPGLHQASKIDRAYNLLLLEFSKNEI